MININVQNCPEKSNEIDYKDEVLMALIKQNDSLVRKIVGITGPIDCKVVLVEGGKLPEMKREGDACFDCYARLDNPVKIKIGMRQLIPLGFKIQLPEYTEAVIRPRSGFTSKGIDEAIGTVDSNYRGEVMACVINNSKEHIEISNGDRICQLAIRRYNPVIFNVVDKLDESNRGEKGFGSTGVK